VAAFRSGPASGAALRRDTDGARRARAGALRARGAPDRGGVLLSFDRWTMASLASALSPPRARGGFGAFL